MSKAKHLHADLRRRQIHTAIHINRHQHTLTKKLMMMNKLLARLLFCISAFLIGRIDGQCNGTRKRKAWSKLTPDEQTNYLNAVETLKTVSGAMFVFFPCTYIPTIFLIMTICHDTLAST